MPDFDYGCVARQIRELPVLPGVPSDDMATRLTAALQDDARHLARAIRESLGEGWEVISHDVSEVEGQLVATYLLRREKR